MQFQELLAEMCFRCFYIHRWRFNARIYIPMQTLIKLYIQYNHDNTFEHLVSKSDEQYILPKT